jgi:hypothetical protein
VSGPKESESAPARICFTWSILIKSLAVSALKSREKKQMEGVWGVAVGASISVERERCVGEVSYQKREGLLLREEILLHPPANPRELSRFAYENGIQVL